MWAYCSGLCVVSTRLLKERGRPGITSEAGRNSGRLFSGYYSIDSLKFHKSTSSTGILRSAVRRIGNCVMLRHLEEMCNYICWYQYICLNCLETSWWQYCTLVNTRQCGYSPLTTRDGGRGEKI